MPQLRPVPHSTGAVVLRSALLEAIGTPHAFSTRIGGVSESPFATLNCAGDVSAGGDDAPARRAENRRRLLVAAGLEGRAIAGLRLVHGADVIDADADADADSGADSDARSGPRRTTGTERTAEAASPGPVTSGVSDGRRRAPEADAIISRDPNLALLITTADCAPILLASRDSGHVAAIHCGWRGAVAPHRDELDADCANRGETPIGIIGATIRRLRAAGPNRLVAAIGPCIGVEAFEVGEEVATEFVRAGLERFVMRRSAWPRPHVDLFGVVHAQLVAAGVPADAIDGVPTCTAADPLRFFSHRRDAGRTGRMAAVIGGVGGTGGTGPNCDRPPGRRESR